MDIKISDEAVGALQNPFKKECVSLIRFEFTKWGNTWEATVRFDNGNTSGSQKFKNENFSAIVKEVEIFCNSL